MMTSKKDSSSSQVSLRRSLGECHPMIATTDDDFAKVVVDVIPDSGSPNLDNKMA